MMQQNFNFHDQFRNYSRATPKLYSSIVEISLRETVQMIYDEQE